MTCPLVVTGPDPGGDVWPDQELDRRLFGVSHHSPAVLRPGPEPHVPQRRRNAVIILSEIVDIVIGVDTHKNTHTAAVVSVDPAPPLEQLTTSADPAGYRTLLAMAERHSLHRVWAIEGTSSYGAGLARFLTRAGETVFEVDRPARAPRRNGVKTDAVDAVRAARELLTRDRQAVPRSYEQRAALSHLLTARRSAVSAAGDAQRQLQSLVVTAPDKLRDPLRELKTPKMVQVCARLRVHPTWDLTTATTAKVLRDLARRV